MHAIWHIQDWGSYFHYDEGAKTIEFKRWSEVGEVMITIKFCKEIAYMLGLIPLLGLPIPILKGGDKIDVTKIDLYRNSLTMLWVAADFIEPTNVGSDLIPILRMVPIQVGTGNLEHSIFGLQYYVSVKRRMTHYFGLSMRELVNGPNIRIRGTVSITLHFKQKE